jgi:RNA polymerase sigma factor (sigma-70 family)
MTSEYEMAEEDEVTRYVARARGQLVGALFLYCGSSSTAEDIAQEALARLWLRWGSVRDRDAWTYRVAFNLARSRWRRIRLERNAVSLLSNARALPPGDPGPAPEVHDALTTALSQLPPRQREAVVRRYFLDQSVAETAEAMRCAPGTVTATVHQAVTRLRTLLPDVQLMEVADEH